MTSRTLLLIAAVIANISCGPSPMESEATLTIYSSLPENARIAAGYEFQARVDTDGAENPMIFREYTWTLSDTSLASIRYDNLDRSWARITTKRPGLLTFKVAINRSSASDTARIVAP